MAHELQQGKAYVMPQTIGSDPIDWLKAQARADDVLLAHQEDGVIWGRSHHDWDWVISHDIANYVHSPDLCADRLWEARLFSEAREILLWREDGAWLAREIGESGGGKPEFTEWFDEPHLLWGTQGRMAQVGVVEFAMLEEGAEGLQHAPPIRLPFDAQGDLPANMRACMRIRHYLAQGDAARVAISRLVALEVYEEKQ